MHNSNIVKMKWQDSKFDLSCTNFADLGFYANQVVYSRVIGPNSKFDLNLNMAMEFPQTIASELNYTRPNVKLRAFFVPFSSVWSSFNDWLVETKERTTQQVLPYSPGIREDYLLRAFLDGYKSGGTRISSYGIWTAGTSSSYDFSCNIDEGLNENGTYTKQYYKLTRYGNNVLTTLHALGYKLNFASTYSSTSYGNVFNGLPLLAYGRVYCDYFQDVNDAVTYHEWNPRRWTSSSSNNLSQAELNEIISCMAATPICLSENWSELASSQPRCSTSASRLTQENSPTVQFQNQTNPTLWAEGFGTNSTSDKTPTDIPSVLSNEGGNMNPDYRGLNKAMIMAAGRVADFVHRRWAGANSLFNRYFAEYGIQLPESLDRAQYLGTTSIGCSTHAIENTAGMTPSTQQGALGAKCFRKSAFGNGSFTYKAKEWGIIMLYANLEQTCKPAFGVNPFIYSNTLGNMYFQDFDGIGFQAVGRRCLGAGNYKSSDGYDGGTGVFGYLPRYWHYKVGFDQCLGNLDMERNSRTAEFGVRSLGSNTAVSTAQNYRYPFSVSNLSDIPLDELVSDSYTNNRFIARFDLGITLTAPMAPLFRTWDFENDGTSNREVEVNVDPKTKSDG